MKHAIFIATLALATAACSRADSDPPSQAALATPVEAVGHASVELAPGVSIDDSGGRSGWFRVDHAEVASVGASHRCTLERINKDKPARGTIIAVASGDPVAFHGWNAAVDMQTPDRFLIVLEDGEKAFAINATSGRDRPDVAAALASDALRDAGFHLKAQMDGVDPGTYAVSIFNPLGESVSACWTPAVLSVSR